MAGWVPTIATVVAYGIGTDPETTGDISLECEVARSKVVLTNYDFATNKLVFKAPIPDTYTGKIYEMALFTIDINPQSGDYGSRLISSFDSASEDWNNLAGADSTFSSVATRVGLDSLLQAPAASATAVDQQKNIQLDFNGYSGSDKFVFAFSCANSNTDLISIAFKTDASNYYAFNFDDPAIGYQIHSIPKSDAIVVGSPNWGSIIEISVATIAKSAGAASVEFDVIRIEDTDSTNLDYIMVARKVLAVPQTKVLGQFQDAEYTLDVIL